MSAKRKWPAQVRILYHRVENGYPRGGMSIEGGEALPSGIYGGVHAAEWLLGQGWPESTIILFRNDHLPHDSFEPMTLKAAVSKPDKALRPKEQKPKPPKPPAAEEKPAPKAPTGSIALKRPKPGGKCAAAWDLMDSLGETATRKQAMEAGAAAGLNPGNVGAEYTNWRKWRMAQ